MIRENKQIFRKNLLNTGMGPCNRNSIWFFTFNVFFFEEQEPDQNDSETGML